MPSTEGTGTDFVSIVVADSTRIHTQLLADALRNDRGLQVVTAASSSEELLAAITRVPIDVAVISHSLDNQPGHGTEVLRQMRALRPQIKGVILMDSSKPQEVLGCFRAGARGIFSKQERLESLCKCIRSVHEGQIWARSIDLDHALDALANSPLVRARDHQGMELLSERERQVIQQVAAGMSNREIAKVLDLSPHTVKNYLFRIFDKLGVSSRTELLYLTLNNSQGAAKTEGGKERANAFSDTIEAAEAGDPLAQLRLAEHFSQIKDVADHSNGNGGAVQPTSISAYMWYLLAERTVTPMLEQIQQGKNNVRQSMTPQQATEAETRAAAWLKNTKKDSGFAPSDETQTEDRQKKHAVAH